MYCHRYCCYVNGITVAFCGARETDDGGTIPMAGPPGRRSLARSAERIRIMIYTSSSSLAKSIRGGAVPRGSPEQYVSTRTGVLRVITIKRM